MVLHKNETVILLPYPPSALVVRLNPQFFEKLFLFLTVTSKFVVDALSELIYIYNLLVTK